MFFPFSLIYFLSITLRKIKFKKNKLKAKIISVGNIISGGTGKTTLIKYILEKIKDKKVCLVSKGYGKEKDEIILIKRNFPDILIFEDKSLKGMKKLEDRYDVILIDDGYHCLWIKKDIDILLIDSFNPFDNNLLIPSGLLREPKSSIKRCDMIILTHTHMIDDKRKKELVDYLKNFKKPVFLMNFKLKSIENEKESLPYEILKEKKILAFSGIGNPFNFFFLLLKGSPQKIYCIPLPDHYSYKKEDISEIENFALENSVDMIITTEKDFVKIKNFCMRIPLYFLKIEIEIEKTDGIDFDSYIEKIVKS